MSEASDEEAPDEDVDAGEDVPEEPTSKREALFIAGGVTVASALAVGSAFSDEHAGTPWMLGSLAIVYTALAAFTVWRLRARGELDEQLRPRGGDLTVGAVVAAVLYGVATGVHLLVTSPPSPRAAWIMHVYATLGDPAAEGRHLLGGAVFVVAALEELVWRGLVQRALLAPFGWLRAWLLQAALFGVAHLPTMFLLGDARVGPNPLLVAAGVAYSLVWGRLAMRMDRLPPALFAHALFTWGVFEFPIWSP
ncbi:CPBP family intramembrane glutamic endopeptidase [Polyangium sp. 6x1]|uniref:CPBP family intramembrane glutamic endopeptidase n=1 Tax=Polyangium sp. 6x1 TaxID=3042689 RepID=UPI002482CD85|nr:CPBP family intramembrane glutamic endopeptidase [Polyangium sp. 6x1]MDI1450657.1 CPBP family intramembrane metalloprotease [Polyangium sp. 6x1]